jgi:serine protease Do
MFRRVVPILSVLGLLAAVSFAGAQAAQRAPQASLGIALEALDPQQPDVIVRQVFPAGPADKAGVKPGDVITKLGDRDVNDYDALVASLAARKPGDQVALQVRRAGKQQELTVTLGQRGATGFEDAPGARPAQPGKKAPYLGIQSAPANLLPGARDGRGGIVVLAVTPDSPAAKAGLRQGDVITGIDGQPMAGPADLRQAVVTAGIGKTVQITARRGDQQMTVQAKLEESPSDLSSRLPPFPSFPGARESRSSTPGVLSNLEEFRRLQQRIDELERRVRELEKQKKGS